MKKLRFLLVDDDADDREFFGEYLSARTDLELLPLLADGEEACRYLNDADVATLPEAILLDQNMPRLTGLQTLQYIKHQPRLQHIPVGICSTYVDANLKQRALGEGAIFVISKPTLSAEFYRLVDGFLD